MDAWIDTHTYIHLYLNFGAGARGTRGIRGSELRFGLENTVGSFEIAIPARSAPAVPSEGPYALAWSRWGLRKCLQGRSGVPRALETASGNAFSVASEPQMHSKGLLRSRLCTRNGCLCKPQSCQVARKACPSQLRNRIAFKLLFESTARSYCSKSHVSATLYSHPLRADPLAKCMECTGSH